MARMHSRKKGQSGSTRPARLERPPWVELSPDEVENEVVKLARRGQSKSMIGTIMRDSRGIPLVKIVAGKKVSQILESHDIKEPLPEDLANLVRKALNINLLFNGG